ncbi:MAG: alpha/beta fold hydrolase [Solirubrobacteraceae bacterium]
MNAPAASPIYIQDGAEPVFGLLHLPAEDPGDTTAVLLCPPFGWDDICSYRSRRNWAEQLAAAGHPVLRIDLPSTGDSGGMMSDPARLSAWTAAVTSAATRLNLESGRSRVTAIGIGLGGIVICRALAEGAPVDEVVLWAVPSRGRTFLRELRVFAQLEDSEFGELSDTTGELESSPLPEGYTGAGGFLLSAETTRALQELDLASLTIPPGLLRRALLLERDGIGPDARLRDHLERLGAEVTVAAGIGYGAMMAKPHLARPPTETFAVVEAWLHSGPPKPTNPPLTQPTTAPSLQETRSSTIELNFAGARIRETPLTIAQPFGQLFGILSEPLDTPSEQLCVVLLNAGGIRHIGPNRMWVEAARRWSAHGVPTLRLDLEGIGDADGDGQRFAELRQLYVPELVDQVIAALDTLEARGLKSRFVLTGLCSGAYWSFHSALRDERVVAALMINPRTLFWNPSIEVARDFRRGLLRRSSWPKILRGEVSPGRMVTLAYRAPLVLPQRRLAAWRARHSGGDELDRALDRLRDTDKHLQFLFTGNEPLHEELGLEGRLDHLDRWPNVTLRLIPGRDHTLRPYESQRSAHKALDLALNRELRRSSASSSHETDMGVATDLA